MANTEGRKPSAEGQEPKTVDVECYAGARYPERPRAFVWNGRRVQVERVLREWQTPSERQFQVETAAGEFRLVYREGADAWLARAT